MAEHMRGLIAATFAPLTGNGELALDRVPALVEDLVADGVSGIFVSGSTGEGESMSAEERRLLATAYVNASRGALPVIVQVGHNSLPEAEQQAAHALAIGAQAIATTAPCYFRPSGCGPLLDYLSAVSRAAPGLPLYYYHIPRLNYVDVDVVELLRSAADHLPDFRGIKFSSMDPLQLRRCIEFDGGCYDILFGVDEMLLFGLYSGVRSAVGSTYNLAAPLYRGVIDAFEAGDLPRASALQNQAVAMVDALLRFPPIAAMKATMEMLGRPVGPPRLPLKPLGDAERALLRTALDEIGFFEWSSARQAT